MNAGPLLALEDVTAGYGRLTVLREVTLHLGADEVLAVLGANGSGKSTVLKTAIGLTRATGGRVHLAGEDITRMPPHGRAALGLAYVPQTRNVFPELSVLDNLRMGGFLHPSALRAGIERVDALFPRLQERRHTQARDLSGGERRMLSIGMALLLQPRVLLLDEPSSDLSPAMVGTVFDAIRRIQSEARIPVLLVEQNVRAALSIADRVCVMARGRCVFECPTAGVDLPHIHDLFMDGGVRTAEPTP